MDFLDIIGDNGSVCNLVSRLTCFLILFCLVSCGESRHRPNILLITLDTTRYDVIQPHITPNLCSAADESDWFEACTSVAPITLPAHASILTGLYPNRHGVRDNTLYRLGDDKESIAELLLQEGYSTTAFISSFVLDSRYGLDQGFQRYSDRFLRPKKRWKQLPVDRRAEETINLALNHLKTNLNEPFFLWIHLYDPHADYNPPEPFDRIAPEEPYVGEVAYMDYHLGRLIRFLRKSRLWYRTLTVIAADHGESLGAHGEPTHGFLLHEPTLHVPLIVHFPEQTEGRRISHPVSLVDIAPTLLTAAGHGGVSCDRVDLYSSMSRPLFSETFIPLGFNWSPLYRVRMGERAYVSSPHDAWYDLREDTGEKRPRKDPPVKLTRSLVKYQSIKPEKDLVHIDQETIDRLRSLGYFMAGGTPPGPENNDAPDPWSKMEIFRLYIDVMSMMEDGQLYEAKERMKKILEDESDNPRFLLLAADLAERMADPRQALKYARKAVITGPEDPRNYLQCGLYAERSGFVSEAEGAYRAALSIRPDHLLARYNLSRLLLIRGSADEAESLLRSLLADAPEMALAWNNLGYLLVKSRGECQEGLEAVKRARMIDPENPLYALSLASALCRCGDLDEGREMLRELERKKIPPELKKQLRGEIDRCN